MFGTTVYKAAPLTVQEIAIGLRSLGRKAVREGRRFRQVCAELDATQWLGVDALRELQLERVRSLLDDARRQVPYYAELFAQHGFEPLSLTDVNELEVLPLLDKATVATNGERMVAGERRGIRFRSSTSGTTGSPLKLRQDLDTIVREHAFQWRQLTWAGWHPGQRRAWMRGDMVVPYGTESPPFWRRNPVEHLLMLSSYHLSERNAPAYLEALERYDPVIIQAYPSSIGFLARYLDDWGRQYGGSSLRAVVTSSETLTDAHRDAILRRFGCRVFDWYGSTERTVAAGTCEHGSYHVIADYGLLQLHRSVGAASPEIVGTGFSNRLMPLIRYRSGDHIEMAGADSACACGRAFPLIERILGRQDDYLKAADGRLIGRLDHIFKDVERIMEAQIVQDVKGEVRIRVVPAGTFDNENRRRLLDNAHERLGDMAVHIDIVDQIPRTRNGKFRAVVCNA